MNNLTLKIIYIIINKYIEIKTYYKTKKKELNLFLNKFKTKLSIYYDSLSILDKIYDENNK